jgi:hypothetical protein
MLILLALAACLLTVPLTGGSLRAVAEVRLDGLGFLIAAVLVQGLLITALSSHDGTPIRVVYVISYALAAGFVWANRRRVGILVIALGGVLNLVAIIANDGVMPARAGAVRHAGISADPGGFTNSRVLEHPHLGWLGDTFATPSGWFFSNVFSVGDVVLVLGALLTVQALGGGRRWRRTRPGASSPPGPRRPAGARPRG